MQSMQTQFEIRCHTTPVVSESVSVEVSVNGKDFTRESTQFHYEAHMHIAEVHQTLVLQLDIL